MRHAGIPTGVHVLLERGGRVLLMRRAGTGFFDGLYSLPGGHVEEGESIRATAVREMREELGVEAGDLVFLHRFLMRSPVETEWVSSYATKHEGPFLPDPGEIDEVRFWTRAEIEAALGTGVLTTAFEDEYARLAR